MAFYTKQYFLFHIDRYHIDGTSEANAVLYLHSKFLNELGFWHRQPRLVRHATEICLIRNLLASQQ